MALNSFFLALVLYIITAVYAQTLQRTSLHTYCKLRRSRKCLRWGDLDLLFVENHNCTFWEMKKKELLEGNYTSSPD